MSIESNESVKFGVMIEVDNLVFSGLEVIRDVFVAKCKALGIADADGFTFLRKAYGKTFSEALQSVLPADYDEALREDAAGELKAAVAAQLQQKAKLSDSFVHFVKELLADKFSVVVSTRLALPAADELFEAFTSNPNFSIAADTSDVVAALPYEVWRRSVQRVGLSPRNTVGVCAGGNAMRGALCAGMHVVVCLDPMVSYEDCSGADLLTQKLDKALIGKMKQALKIQ